MSDNYGGSRAPPVSEGDELELNIEAVGEKGDGIAKKDGFVVFVPNTQVGQNVKVKITRVLRKMAFGDVIGEGSAPVKEAPTNQASAEEKKQAPAQEITEDVSEEAPQEHSEDSEDF
jgi:predicted RNA-binding protein with TRAM domain